MNIDTLVYQHNPPYISATRTTHHSKLSLRGHQKNRTSEAGCDWPSGRGANRRTAASEQPRVCCCHGGHPGDTGAYHAETHARKRRGEGGQADHRGGRFSQWAHASSSGSDRRQYPRPTIQEEKGWHHIKDLEDSEALEGKPSWACRRVHTRVPVCVERRKWHAHEDRLQ